MIEAPCREKKPLSVGLLGNAAEIFPSWSAAASGPTSSPTRPPRMIRVNGYLPQGWTRGAVGGAARARPERRSTKAAKRFDGGACPRHARFPPQGRADVRLRQQHPPDGEGGGRRRRLRLPGLRAGLYPPAVLPRHRAVPLGGAVGRPRGHLPHRRQGEGAAARTTRTCTTGSTWPASASTSRACPRASAGSGSATATGSASPSTRWSPGASSRRRS